MTVLELALAVFVVATAVLAAAFRDLIGVVATFAAFSLGVAVVWLLLAAPDVALTEAAVGAGVMAMLLLVAIVTTSRDAFGSEQPLDEAFRPLDRPAVVLVAAVGIPLAYAVSFLPAIGDPNAPAVSSTTPAGDPAPYGQYVGPEAAELGVQNGVAAVLILYRSLDTLGEVIVAFAAVIGVLVVLGRERATEARSSRRSGRADRRTAGESWSLVAFPDPYVTSPVVSTALRIVVPPVFAFGVYLTLHGTTLPAGGFQGGVVIGSAFVLVGLAFGLGPTIQWIDERALVAAMCLGVGTFLAVAFGAVAVGGEPFELPAYADAMIVAMVLIELGIGLLVGGVVTALVVVTAAGVADPTGGIGVATDERPNQSVESDEENRSVESDEEGCDST